MNVGRIIALSVSVEKGRPKDNVEVVEFEVDHGIRGDVHAGPGDRQVSLLALERFHDLDGFRLPLRPGIFGENVTVEGLDTRELGPGDMLRLGATAVLEVTLIGKECHTPCAIGRTVGKCIMPLHGVFTRVTKAGRVVVGDEVVRLKLGPGRDNGA